MNATTNSTTAMIRIRGGRAVAISIGFLVAGLFVLVYANYQHKEEKE